VIGDWWGEAPEEIYGYSEAHGVHPPETAARPLSAPSRGLSWVTARRVYQRNGTVLLGDYQALRIYLGFLGSLALPVSLLFAIYSP
jgi:hypothetical protein